MDYTWLDCVRFTQKGTSSRDHGYIIRAESRHAVLPNVVYLSTHRVFYYYSSVIFSRKNGKAATGVPREAQRSKEGLYSIGPVLYGGQFYMLSSVRKTNGALSSHYTPWPSATVRSESDLAKIRKCKAATLPPPFPYLPYFEPHGPG